MNTSCTSCATVGNTSQARPGSVQQAASISVQKKAMQLDQSTAAQLIAALPNPPLATSGGVGTQVNTFV